MQGCVRIVLAVKSAAMPDVLSGKDLIQGNGLSQAGGALFQVLGVGFAFGSGAALPPGSWSSVGAGLLVAAAIVAQAHASADGGSAHRTSFGAGSDAVLRDIVDGIRELAARPPGRARARRRSR